MRSNKHWVQTNRQNFAETPHVRPSDRREAIDIRATDQDTNATLPSNDGPYVAPKYTSAVHANPTKNGLRPPRSMPLRHPAPAVKRYLTFIPIEHPHNGPINLTGLLCNKHLPTTTGSRRCPVWPPSLSRASDFCPSPVTPVRPPLSCPLGPTPSAPLPDTTARYNTQAPKPGTR